MLGCVAPERLEVTWEYAGDVSWVVLTLAEHGTATALRLEHSAVVDQEKWGEFGPGAVGIGWEMALGGLGLHLADPGFTPGQPDFTHPGYPDTGGTESTDGVATPGFGVGHGYELATSGETRTVDITVDLGAAKSISKIRTSKYDDGVHDYAPSVVRAFTCDDAVTMTARGQTSTANGRWYELPAAATARYV